MISTAEKVARAIADADGEDYMEDYARYDKRAEAAIEAYRAAAITTTPEPVAPSPSQVHIVFSHLPDHDPPRFIEVENAEGKSINFGEWRMRPDGLAELVFPAPTPSPDIAGLVERFDEILNEDAPNKSVWKTAESMDEWLRASVLPTMRLAAITLQRVAQERDAANVEIARLQAIVGKDPNTVMIAFEDGAHQRLSRATGDAIRRAEAAEARLSSARDEGLEMAAKVADELRNAATPGEHKLFGQGMANAADQISIAIRALKGTKP